MNHDCDLLVESAIHERMSVRVKNMITLGSTKSIIVDFSNLRILNKVITRMSSKSWVDPFPILLNFKKNVRNNRAHNLMNNIQRHW